MFLRVMGYSIVCSKVFSDSFNACYLYNSKKYLANTILSKETNKEQILKLFFKCTFAATLDVFEKVLDYFKRVGGEIELNFLVNITSRIGQVHTLKVIMVRCISMLLKV